MTLNFQAASYQPLKRSYPPIFLQRILMYEFPSDKFPNSELVRVPTSYIVVNKGQYHYLGQEK